MESLFLCLSPRYVLYCRKHETYQLAPPVASAADPTPRKQKKKSDVQHTFAPSTAQATFEAETLHSTPVPKKHRVEPMTPQVSKIPSLIKILPAKNKPGTTRLLHCSYVRPDDKSYTVERILKTRLAASSRRNGPETRQFLVRWVGYSPESDTWEPESHLHPELTRAFLHSQTASEDVPSVHKSDAHDVCAGCAVILTGAFCAGCGLKHT